MQKPKGFFSSSVCSSEGIQKGQTHSGFQAELLTIHIPHEQTHFSKREHFVLLKWLTSGNIISKIIIVSKNILSWCSNLNEGCTWEKIATANVARLFVVKYDVSERKYPVRLHASHFLVAVMPGADSIMPTAIPRRHHFDSAPALRVQYCGKIKLNLLHHRQTVLSWSILCY